MKILIYREDQKILLIKRNDNWLLPQFNNEDLKQLRQEIKTPAPNIFEQSSCNFSIHCLVRKFLCNECYIPR